MIVKRMLFVLLMSLLTTTACNSSSTTTPAIAAKTKSLTNGTALADSALSSDVATIKTVHGNMKFKFYDQDAPKTAKRIRELIKKGFYDGLIFHRVVPGFVIQGGDPTGTGTSGSGTKLKAEFNSRKHIFGTVAMARSQDPDSADSQFYIAMGAFPNLDGKYTVFGHVVEGLEIIKKVNQGDKMISVSLK